MLTEPDLVSTVYFTGWTSPSLSLCHGWELIFSCTPLGHIRQQTGKQVKMLRMAMSLTFACPLNTAAARTRKSAIPQKSQLPKMMNKGWKSICQDRRSSRSAEEGTATDYQGSKCQQPLCFYQTDGLFNLFPWLIDIRSICLLTSRMVVFFVVFVESKRDKEINLSVSLDKLVCQMNQFEDRITQALSFKSPLKEQTLISAGSRQVTELIPVFVFLVACLTRWYWLWQEQHGKCSIPFHSWFSQHNFFPRGLQLSVTLQSYPSPLYIVMKAERRSPLLPFTPRGSLRLCSLHTTGTLPVCHPRIPGGPAEEFAGRWHGSSSLLLARRSHGVIYSC